MFGDTQLHRSNPDSTQPAHEVTFIRQKYYIH